MFLFRSTSLTRRPSFSGGPPIIFQTIASGGFLIRRCSFRTTYLWIWTPSQEDLYRKVSILFRTPTLENRLIWISASGGHHFSGPSHLVICSPSKPHGCSSEVPFQKILFDVPLVSFSGQHFSGVTFSQGILDFGAGPHGQEVSLSGGLFQNFCLRITCSEKVPLINRCSFSGVTFEPQEGLLERRFSSRTVPFRGGQEACIISWTAILGR